MLLVVFTQGHVVGQEFSPTHFRQRHFDFYEIPLLHWQITPIRRRTTTPETARFVRQRAFVRTAPGTPTTWHLVSISRGVTGSTPGDAELLTTQLGMIAEGGQPYWKRWSQDHPGRAKVLWPVIQRLAIRELYVLMPPLLELAQFDRTPAELAATVDASLRREYGELVRDMQAANRDALAQELLREALQDYPDDPQLNRLASERSP